jgi:exopolyphosphatase
VSEVVDHHVDEHTYPGLARTRIELVGSCSSLVADEILHAEPAGMDTDLASLLLSAVLIDTVNLDPAAGRATDLDRRIAGQLRSACPALDSDALYGRVLAAKTDIARLSTFDLLRRDSKAFGAARGPYVISSVPVRVAALLADPRRAGELRPALDRLAAAAGASLAAVMVRATGKEVVMVALSRRVQGVQVDPALPLRRDILFAPLAAGLDARRRCVRRRCGADGA